VERSRFESDGMKGQMQSSYYSLRFGGIYQYYNTIILCPQSIITFTFMKSSIYNLMRAYIYYSRIFRWYSGVDIRSLGLQSNYMGLGSVISRSMLCEWTNTLLTSSTSFIQVYYNCYYTKDIM
jgi:hypothetical protein